ncbi:MAG: hypothetical protein SPD42_03080 [Eubacteriales bacterium]|nr:hypothetical protein [Eubacteriales bacterium]
MIKEKLKSVNFWIAIVSAIVMTLRAFGVEMGGEEIDNAVSGIAGVLLIFGISFDPKSFSQKVKSNVNAVSEKTEIVKIETAEKIEKNGQDMVDKNTDTTENHSETSGELPDDKK